jgi:ABC-2 type transport system permease protein
VFGASYAFLKYINSVAVAGPLIINKLLALIFITAFMMSALSAVIVSFSTVYFGKDIKWLLTSHVKLGEIFSFKAVNSSFYASWMVFAAMVPFMAALGVVKNADIWFYVFSAVFVLPFLASASFAGIGFTVIVMRFFPAAKIRNIIFIIGMVFFTFVLVLVRLAQPEKFVSSEGFELLSQYLGYLDAPTAKFLPSWWYTAAVTGLISKDFDRIFIYAGLLFGTSAVLWFAVKLLAEKFYMEGLNEGQAFASSDIQKRSFERRSPVFAIFQKDIKVFIRDSNQWSQLLILASIVLVYLFSMYKLSFETIKMHNTMSVINCALVWFVATAVSLRLSFPLISLEGESFWFLLTGPVSRLKLFIEKIAFGTIPVFIVSVILMFATNYMMGISKPVFIITMIATVSMSLLISCCAVSIGTILPKFNYSNIPQIESSLGGLVFMLFSFLMIIVNILIIMQPLRLFYLKNYKVSAFIEYGAVLVLLDAVFFVIISAIGYNALKRIEK